MKIINYLIIMDILALVSTSQYISILLSPAVYMSELTVKRVEVHAHSIF